MTQTAQPPIPAPAPPPGAPRPNLPAQATAAPPATVSRTAGRLNALGAVALVTGVLFGVLGALLMVSQALAVGAAADNAEQLVRVQQIETNLLAADATATNAFLVGGLEPTEQRAHYDQLLESSSQLIAAASLAQPADQEALGALNQELLAYASTVEQARANNRQGLPVGAQYQRTASAELRAGALPILDNLVAANTQRTQDEMGSRAGGWMIVVGVVALAVMVLISIWLARRFRRTLNLPMLAAGGAVLLATVIGGVILNAADNALDDLETGSFARLTAASQARIAGNNAKSNESLTLIARGSGGTFEEAWKTSAGKVDTQLEQLDDEATTTAWAGYVTVHTTIRSLDDGGDWDAAVELATGTGDDSSNFTFGRFDTTAAAVLDTVSAETTSGLASATVPLYVQAVLCLIAGLLAAALGRRGIAQRQREYR